MQTEKPQYLIKVGTKRVLGYSEILAARTDMIPCDKDGNRLDVGGPTAGENVLQLRIKELEGMLANSQDGGLSMELEATKSSLVTANDRIAELVEGNESLTAQVASLEAELVKVSKLVQHPTVEANDPTSVQLENFLTDTAGMGAVERKKELAAWAQEQLGTTLDSRASMDKMIERARAAA